MGWLDFAGVFLMGLLGAGHCLGMCGAFAIAVGAGAPDAGMVAWRQVSYQLGKATSYAFIGVLLTLAGGWISEAHPLFGMQRLIGYGVGAAMAGYGLMQLFEWRPAGIVAAWWEGSGACHSLGALWRSPSLARSVLIGWINGFLPCGLSLSALLYAASFGSVTDTVASAYVFGLGTLPALLAVSLAGRRLGGGGRRRLVRAGGVLLVFFGVLTMVRGLPAVHHWLHQHLVFDFGGGAGNGHHGH